jgi:Ca-activated chloride channel family protein
MSAHLELLVALALAASPFQAEQPDVKAGNAEIERGDGAAALPHYDAAEREVGKRPELEFDRGHAHQRAGRTAEAQEAWTRASGAAVPGPLASRAQQNSASLLEGAGDREGAIRALAEALRRDPANDDARYNLEVLLRRKSQGAGKPKDEGQQGPKKQDGPPNPGQGAKPPEDPKSQGQRPDQQAGEPPRPDQQQDKERGRRDQRGGQHEKERLGPGQPPAERLGKQDAERLLDALRSREKTMPLGPVGRKEPRRREVERDW